MARIIGTSGDDWFNGADGQPPFTAGHDNVYGLGGQDFISGDGQNDWLFGGAGDDYLFGDGFPSGDWHDIWPIGGNDRLYGERGDDYLDGEGGDDRLDGGAGNDFITDRLGANIAYGRDGNDTLDVSGYGSGGAGDDYLQSRVGGAQLVSAVLNGGPGADGFNLWLDGTDDPAAPRVSVTVQDFRPAQGDYLLATANVALADGTSPDSLWGQGLKDAFDSNRTGVLGDGDMHAFAEKGGVLLQWYNIDAHIHTAHAADIVFAG